MAGVNGQVEWQIQPFDFDSSNLAGAFWNFRANTLKSANDQLRYQVIWTNASGLNEGVEPSAANFSAGNGDVIAIIFTVEVSVGDGYWETLGRIKKTRDIANRKYTDGSQPAGHRFTVDISQLVSGELSYSLCPINKGTWQSNFYGGMNGGLTMQDNVLGTAGVAMGNPITKYNVSRNGTYRIVRVIPSIQIINGNGDIVDAGNVTSSKEINIINSVNQFEKDDVYYNYSSSSLAFDIDKYSSGTAVVYRFLTRCPNTHSLSSPSIYQIKKPIRMDEQAEFLQFQIKNAYHLNINSGSDFVGAIGLKVETFDSSGAENTFYLTDFENNAATTTNGTLVYWQEIQKQAFIQNVSPYYINNTASLKKFPTSFVTFPYWANYTGSKITSSTTYYRVSLVKVGLFGSHNEVRDTTYQYYSIDREDDNIPYKFVRFHWLNSMGGTDSYTAKRDVVEGLTISRDVIERKSGDRTWYQGDQNNGSTMQPSVFISDSMRGGDIYKGGREVSNINAERTQSVYTEPLNKIVAKWLEEMMLSPNVWIEMDTEATQMGNVRNSHLRPSDKEYIPVIITNSDVETVNQAEGLVKFNIEYTLAHKVITQRN
tara:strand:+ start:1057 stop:2850 length:1794 start_codon:yes stop_codon:yes gene_type:complete